MHNCTYCIIHIHEHNAYSLTSCIFMNIVSFTVCISVVRVRYASKSFLSSRVPDLNKHKINTMKGNPTECLTIISNQFTEPFWILCTVRYGSLCSLCWVEIDKTAHSVTRLQRPLLHAQLVSNWNKNTDLKLQCSRKKRVFADEEERTVK